ncbi:MAG: DNA polymerase IV [Acidobacteria bacterium]|nr:MAG: DNA polymerase IV [Acidobacteriota bacterium]
MDGGRGRTGAGGDVRIILHLDMDAFFAAIEQRERPELRGKPVIVGRRGPRGVVTTCSYEARPYGVRSAMPSVTAERLCPDAVWIAPRGALYREVSRRVFAIVEERVPVVERVSIDEAYGDLTGAVAGFEEAAELARELKERIRRSERLTASVGIAPCRFLAKIASDLDKPDGLVVIRSEDVPRVLHPLPVRAIPGVGPRMAERLARLGLRTVGDVARCPDRRLRRALGARTAEFLRRRARGEDDTPVEPVHERKQVSEERTYVHDLHDREAIERELLARALGVAGELRRRGLVARTVTLKVRDDRYRTVTRSRTLAEPTDLASTLFRVALELFRERVELGGRGIRLLGLGASQLAARHDLPPALFPDEREEKERVLGRIADSLRERFGKEALRPARLLPGARPEDGR